MSTSKGEGRREDALAKQREQMREEFERQKQSLINETEKARPSTSRFVGQNDSMEDSLKNNTIGLVKLEDFQQKRKEIEEIKAREAARTNELKYVHMQVLLLHSLSLFLPPRVITALAQRSDRL
jgi:protein FAM50